MKCGRTSDPRAERLSLIHRTVCPWRGTRERGRTAARGIWIDLSRRAKREVSIAATDFAPLGLLFLGRNLLNAQCKQGEGKGIRAAFLNRDILDVSAACRESFRVLL